MSNSLEFKIKYNGQKLLVRVMNDDEKIKPNSLQHYISNVPTDKTFALESDNAIENLQRLSWVPSKCVGEKIGGVHGGRIYIEVLSPFFTPLSTNEHTESEYC